MPNKDLSFFQVVARIGHKRPLEIAQISGQSCTVFCAFSAAEMTTTRLIIRKTVPDYPINTQKRLHNSKRAKSRATH